MRNVSLTVSPQPPPPLFTSYPCTILGEEVAAGCGYACACVYAFTQCTKQHSVVIAIMGLRRWWRLMCFDSYVKERRGGERFVMNVIQMSGGGGGAHVAKRR